MAENKEVVEMFDKFLASLIKLVNKWLIDWSVDTKKLLHTLHNIKKEDLLGLLEGTHSIVKKESSSVSGKFLISSTEEFKSLVHNIYPEYDPGEIFMREVNDILPLSIEKDLSKYNGHKFGTEKFDTMDKARKAIKNKGYRPANGAELLYWIKEREEVDNITDKTVIIGGVKYNKNYWICCDKSSVLLCGGDRELIYWDRSGGSRRIRLTEDDGHSMNEHGFFLAIRLG